MNRTEQFEVVIYGLGNTLQDAIEYIRQRFNVVGCSDSNIEKKAVAEKMGVPFITKDMLKQVDYDYILIVSIYDNEIKEQLIENVGIEEQKILCRIQWGRMIFHYSMGDLNADKKFYILSRPIHIRDGLFSFLFSFLEQMDYVDKNGYIPVVDMQNYRNQYLEEDKIGIENAWKYYYEPLSDSSLEEVYSSKHVVLGYDDSCYKGDYEKKYDIKRMSELYNKYVHYNKNTILEIEKEYERQIDAHKTTLGVLYRGSDMSALKLKNHPIQPTVDEMKKMIYQYMKEWKCERIFLSTEDAVAAAEFKAEFGDIISFTDQKRFDHTGSAWLANISFARENDKYLRGLEYITTIELLARCDCLLAGICAGSVCAQIMNGGKYKHIRMIDKGEY